MTTTITVELHPDDRARLDRILAALEGRNCKGCVETAVKYATAVHGAHPAGHAEAAPEPEPTPTVSETDIQKLCVKLSANGKKKEARAILNEYADRVSRVPPAQRQELYDRLTALEG